MKIVNNPWLESVIDVYSSTYVAPIVDVSSSEEADNDTSSTYHPPIVDVSTSISESESESASSEELLTDIQELTISTHDFYRCCSFCPVTVEFTDVNMYNSHICKCHRNEPMWRRALSDD